MPLRDVLVTEESDSRNSVHILRVEEADVLGKVADAGPVLGRKRMAEGHAEAAVAVLYVEDDGVSAKFVPSMDQAHPLNAAGHSSCQVYGANVGFFLHRTRLLLDGL